jgi:catalase
MSDQREQQRPLTTTDSGSPAPSDEYSLTVGAGGPNLLQDRYLNEKLAHFVRERIAKGLGLEVKPESSAARR